MNFINPLKLNSQSLLSTIIFCLALSGCAVSGKSTVSEGVIAGWNFNKNTNKKEGLELVISAQNTIYHNIDEVLLGIPVKSQLEERHNTIGKAPFKIDVLIYGDYGSHAISSDAKLLIYGQEYTVNETRKSPNNKITPNKESFLRFDKLVEKHGLKWVEYSFNIQAPNPSETFQLELKLMNNDLTENIVVNFNPKDRTIYHN